MVLPQPTEPVHLAVSRFFSHSLLPANNKSVFTLFIACLLNFLKTVYTSAEMFVLEWISKSTLKFGEGCKRDVEKLTID